MHHKLFLAIILCCCSKGFFRGVAAPAGVSSIRALGQEYRPLDECLKRWQLDLNWKKQDDELRASNKSASLEFKLNSQRAEINGVSVFLSFPILAQRGEAFIAAQDVDQLLAPILSPRSNTPYRVKTVALCPGHGGRDPGFQVGADQEKKYTLLLAKEVQRRLAAAGLKVVMLRDSDRTVSHEARTAAAKRRKADVYVSLHYNSAGPHGQEARGAEVYCLTLPGSQSTNGGTTRAKRAEPGDKNNSKSVLLAYQMQRSLVRQLEIADRGVRRARFVVLRLAEMPAVLIETAFMSNPDEMKRIKDSAYRQRVAQAIVDGLLAYKRQVER
jgi:N-acetylmuramoyl-L-alanine amidase